MSCKNSTHQAISANRLSGGTAISNPFIEKCSGDLYESLSPEGENLLLCIQNEGSLYRERLIAEQLTLKGSGTQVWMDWVEKGYLLYRSKYGIDPVNRADRNNVSDYLMADALDRISSGEIVEDNSVYLQKEEEPKAGKMVEQEITPEQVDAILVQSITDGNYLRLSEQLNRKSYNKVAEILNKLGGKWKSGKVMAFEFAGDAEEAIQSYLSSKTFPDLNPYDYFRTPDKVSEDVVFALGNIPAGSRVLEPSAGDGSIAEAIQKTCKTAKIDVLEIEQGRKETLQSKGFNLVGDDFLVYSPDKPYDFIAMNPPFRQGIYADHILHAYELLKPGGTMVAIAPTTVETAEKNKKILAIRNLKPTFKRMEAGSFAESGTMVNTCLVQITKPLN